MYKARDLRTQAEVAIKIVSLVEDAAVEDVRQVLLRIWHVLAQRKEIGILKEFTNPFIIKYFGSYFENENLWVNNQFSAILSYPQIIMEYCEGGSIGEILRITEKSLSENQISLICAETLKVDLSIFE